MTAELTARTRPMAKPAPSDPRGQGLMEFALILPLLLLFVLGIIEAGRVLAIYSSLSSAAKQAARYGSVAGEPAGQPFYLDCAGMIDTAVATSLFVGLTSSDVDIRYDRGTTAEPIGFCPPGAASPTLSETIRDGYRVIISISATYEPLVPLVPIPELPINFAAARTIFTTIVGPTNTPRPNPDLSITKSGTPSIVSPNGFLTYWITTTNSAGSGVANGLVVTDTLPAQVTLTQDDLEHIADHHDWTCTFVVTSPPQQIRCSRLAPLSGGQSAGFSYAVRAPLFGGVTLINVAEVGSSKADSQPGNNVAQTSHPVLAGADLQPYQTVSPEGEVGAGAALTYTLWVYNNGSEVSDTKASSEYYIWMTSTLPTGSLPYKSLAVPGGWFCMTLFAPERLSCRYQNDLSPNEATPSVTLVLTAPTVAGPMTNVLISAPSPMTADPIADNNSATVTNQVVTHADVAITKLGTTSANGGGNLLYTLRATNFGPSVAANVRLTDTVPGTILSITPGTGWACESPVVNNTLKCVWASLASGATTTDIAVAITVPNHNISNTAGVGSDMPDLNAANNTATVDTTVTVCNAGRAFDANSTITASPAAVQADGTSIARVTVDLKDMCGNPATDSQTVTLIASRAGQDTITVASGSSNPTTTGRVVFEVRSAAVGTSTYTATASNHIVSETVTLSATTSVNFFGCLNVTGQKNQVSTQTYVDFRLTNLTDRAWRLVSLALDWPPTNGRKLTQVVMNTTPPTTLWSGNSNSDPFSLPGSAAWNGGTDAARTISPGVAGQSLLFHFSRATPGETYSLVTTWDDGNGNTCTKTTTVVP